MGVASIESVLFLFVVTQNYNHATAADETIKSLWVLMPPVSSEAWVRIPPLPPRQQVKSGLC